MEFLEDRADYKKMLDILKQELAGENWLKLCLGGLSSQTKK
jgi:hypothetical protein